MLISLGGLGNKFGGPMDEDAGRRKKPAEKPKRRKKRREGASNATETPSMYPQLAVVITSR